METTALRGGVQAEAGEPAEVGIDVRRLMPLAMILVGFMLVAAAAVIWINGKYFPVQNANVVALITQLEKNHTAGVEGYFQDLDEPITLTDKSGLTVVADLSALKNRVDWKGKMVISPLHLNSGVRPVPVGITPANLWQWIANKVTGEPSRIYYAYPNWGQKP